MPVLALNHARCARCGLCAAACPWWALTPPIDSAPRFTDDGAKRCRLCGHCEAACPAGAIEINDPRIAPAMTAFGAGEVVAEQLGRYLWMRRSVRRYRNEPVERHAIARLIDVCRCAPTGRNQQDVGWLVMHDTGRVRRLASMAVDWMLSIADTDSPFAARFDVAALLRAWETGYDPFCHHAPHLVFAHIGQDNPVAATNAVIALTHLDITAPSFGLGSCWAGMLLAAINSCDRLLETLDLPPGRVPAHCLMLGYPAISYWRPPKRVPASVVWR